MLNSGQKKIQSWIEAIVNSVAGFLIAIAAQEVLFPRFGMHLPLSAHLTLGLCFTAVSVIRSYALRRLFNFIQQRYI